MVGYRLIPGTWSSMPASAGGSMVCWAPMLYCCAATMGRPSRLTLPGLCFPTGRRTAARPSTLLMRCGVRRRTGPWWCGGARQPDRTIAEIDAVATKLGLKQPPCLAVATTSPDARFRHSHSEPTCRSSRLLRRRISTLLTEELARRRVGARISRCLGSCANAEWRPMRPCASQTERAARMSSFGKHQGNGTSTK
jgi:hypothetical protein